MTVRSRNVGSVIGAGLKSLVGGELKGMTEMLASRRQDATDRLVEEAAALDRQPAVGCGTVPIAPCASSRRRDARRIGAATRHRHAAPVEACQTLLRVAWMSNQSSKTPAFP